MGYISRWRPSLLQVLDASQPALSDARQRNLSFCRRSIALRLNLPRIYHSLLSHDRSRHNLPPNRLLYPPSHSSLPWPRQSSSRAVLFPRQIRCSHKRDRHHLGSTLRRCLLPSHRQARHTSQYELCICCYCWVDRFHHQFMVRLEEADFHRAED